ncbi:MAG: hypothetical protein Q4A15_04505 [Prevotellaceae bacterium]|nr:hypothetical protein [Prevotellaceae bacterium]
MNDGLTASDVALLQGNGRNGGLFGDGDGIWAIILFAIIFGWGRNGWGGNSDGGNGGTYLGENYALITDNATLERKIDGVYAGQCDSTFAIVQNLNNGFASSQNTMTQGFAGLNTALVTQGYETRNAVTQDTIGNMQNTNLLQGAIKDCCCQTQQNLADVKYTIGSTGAGIQNQIQSCCCDVERQIERGFADTNYAMAQQNCATLQAIDKVGDRIIDRLTQDKLDALRDENSALRLSASQSAQNQYLINQLRPCPSPAYVVPNPFCNCNCNNGYNYNGTTIA